MLKDLIRLYIAPILKRAGFKKKGMIWNRKVDGYIQVIDFRATKSRSNGFEVFTINVGILIVELWQLLWSKDVPPFVKEENCYPRFRLGYLLSDFDPKSRDKWWTIQSRDELDAIGKEIEGVLIEKCLPFFDGIKSAADALELSKSANPRMPIERLSHAILLNTTGNKTDSDQLMGNLCSDSHWGARATEVADRLNQRS